ncbi:LOW QUALITY PROTEIN: heat shock factor protein 5 [Strix aluco]|uniref:LOW QUALITY PROTEIN: heat shock factor protein 5 n=1 Tax=Strix aluco TaxID=111821 RepID=UPI003DA50F72
MEEPQLPADINPNNFPAKLWRLVNSPRVQSICWDARGEGLIIDQPLFEREVLGMGPGGDGASGAAGLFKTKSFASLTRQFNLYGFRKLGETSSVAGGRQDGGGGSPGPLHRFYSPHFLRDHPDLLVRVKRLTKANKAKLAAGLEVKSRPPTASQRLLGTAMDWDPLLPPSALGEANGPGEAGGAMQGLSGFEKPWVARGLEIGTALSQQCAQVALLPVSTVSLRGSEFSKSEPSEDYSTSCLIQQLCWFSTMTQGEDLSGLFGAGPGPRVMHLVGAELQGSVWEKRWDRATRRRGEAVGGAGSCSTSPHLGRIILKYFRRHVEDFGIGLPFAVCELSALEFGLLAVEQLHQPYHQAYYPTVILKYFRRHVEDFGIGLPFAVCELSALEFGLLAVEQLHQPYHQAYYPTATLRLCSPPAHTDPLTGCASPTASTYTHCSFLQESTSVNCEPNTSETEGRQFASGTEPVNKSVEETDSSVTPRCRKRDLSSHEGKSSVWYHSADMCPETHEKNKQQNI